MVETVSVDGLPLEVKGDTFVLLVIEGDDRTGAEDAAEAGDVTQAQLQQLTADLPGTVDVRSVVRLRRRRDARRAARRATRS